jgi:pyruvate/2-oxoglutarate dehydrogenase complex dihydrolipoamide dehydrogenase (E3) component
MEFAKTGLSEQEAKINSIPVDVCTVSARNHARYYPDGSQITIKLCYRRDNRVLVGAQLSGEKGSAIRIQPLATAIDRQMIVDEVGFLDLGYAPPFTSVWDAIQIAANVAR